MQTIYTTRKVVAHETSGAPGGEPTGHGNAAPHTFDIDRLREYRLTRVRDQLKKHDYVGCVLFDPINIRYATDSTNMSVWTSAALAESVKTLTNIMSITHILRIMFLLSRLCCKRNVAHNSSCNVFITL